MQYSSIRRHKIAGLQFDDIAWHDFRRRHSGDVAVTPHLGARRGHFAQRGDGFLGIEFLIKSDDRIEHNDGENSDGIHDFAQGAAENPRRDENPNDQALELPEEDGQRADGLGLLEFIWAALRQTARGFFRRQSAAE